MKLITDRKQTNVNRLEELSRQRWDSLNAAEKAEWSGDPLLARIGGYMDPVNLVPNVGEGVIIRNGSIYCEEEGYITIGNTTDWMGRQITLSCEHMSSGGSIRMVLQASASTSAQFGVLAYAGSKVVNVPSNQPYGTIRMVFAPGYYSKVMLELYYTAHPYVPYYAILPTNATKGAYNYSDMNRVEMAVRDIAELLELDVSVKTDWSGWDIPTQDDINRYLNNLKIIRDRLQRNDVLPDTLNHMTYTIANDIESFLEIAYRCADDMCRVGDVFCGEV